MESKNPISRPPRQQAQIPQKKIYKVSDLEEDVEVNEELPEPQMVTLPSLPSYGVSDQANSTAPPISGAQPMDPEAFRQYQKKKNDAIAKQNEIDDKTKEALNALLGFGVASDTISLFNNGIEYRFKLRNLTEPEQNNLTKEQLHLEKEIAGSQDVKLTEEQIRNKKIDYIFKLRILTLTHSVQSVEIVTIPGQESWTYTLDEIVNHFDLETPLNFFRTWSGEAIELLFQKYNSIVDGISNNLKNVKKLNDDLKKS